MREVPFGNDGDFCMPRYPRINSELANGLGIWRSALVDDQQKLRRESPTHGAFTMR